jgi:hypothetical protein
MGDEVMAEKKVEPGQTSSRDPTTQPVVELLTSILNEVQKQVQSEVQKQVQTTTPTPLAGGVQRALDQFREIGAALALQPRPTIQLIADPTQLGIGGGTVKLTWSSTDAQTVSINPNIGEVRPVAAGFVEVPVLVTTTFGAFAKGFCASAEAKAKVIVANPT